MNTTITTRLEGRKAATVEIPQETAIPQEENLPQDVGYDAAKQLETDDTNQRDRPVRWTLPHSLLTGEAEEVDSPLPLQGSSPSSHRAGFSQQDGQGDRLEPGKELCARRSRGP
eukprot:2757781-Ditylum_brightwellii.AAC.1